MAFFRRTASAIVFFAAMATANGQEMSLICTSGGVNYQVGEIACIPACYGKERLARCVASNGVATWSTISDSCPSAMTPILPWTSRTAAVPALSVPPSEPQADIAMHAFTPVKNQPVSALLRLR